MDTTYEEWKAEVENIVEAFSDLPLQRAAWLGRVATACASPGEMMCVFFDDLDVPRFIDEYQARIGNRCTLAGIAATHALRSFDWPMQGDFIDAIAVLDHPNWQSVCLRHREFLGNLRHPPN